MSDKNIDKDTKKFLDNMGNRLKLAKENGCKLLDCKTIDNNIKLRLENIKLRKELEIKDKMIDSLVEFIDGLNDDGEYDMFCYLIHGNNCNGYKEDRSKDKCKNCIKEYFRNEVLKSE